MAAYQIVIFFVPKEWYRNGCIEDDILTKEGCFDASRIWAVSPQRNLVKGIFNNTFCSEGESFWKSEGENDYSIDEGDLGEIECVRARVDGRIYSQGELKRILILAHACDCVLYLPEFKRTLDPSVQALEPLDFLVKRSRAYKWGLSNN